MHNRIVIGTCAAAVLSVALASAQTSSPTSDPQRRTPTAAADGTDQRVTMTGCLMQSRAGQNAGWTLSNAATLPNGTASATNRGASSRSGSPSDESSTSANAANRNGTGTTGVAGTTSTTTGTSGVAPGSTTDTEANGRGVGATDQKGGTVGAGAAAGAIAGTSARGTSATGNSSYQVTGVANPTQYANKQVEVIGTVSDARGNADRMLRVTSVRVISDTCR